MELEGVHRLIDSADSAPFNFPPTLLYNEGWLLRLILDWYSAHKLAGQLLMFQTSATWFSEALLPSPFRARHRGDIRAEARTHADGVVGHFSVGSIAKADARLLPDATQFMVTEAKIYSPLSGGTRNAPSFDQAARNVACIAEILGQAHREPSQMTSLAFFVIAPEAQIKAGLFAQKLDKAAIGTAVQDRARSFGPELDSWLVKWFRPTLETIRIEALSWESLIGDIASKDQAAFQAMQVFYERCLLYNRPGAQFVPTE